MKTINIQILLIGLSILGICMLCMSCSEDGPTSPSISDFSGTWKGGIQHPAYDVGSLEIVMVEKEAINGSYTMWLTEYIVSNGRTRVLNLGGAITDGNRNDRSSVSFTLDVDGSLWDFSGTSETSNTISGNWNVRSRTGISGTFQISK